MTTELDKASAEELVSRLGGRVFQAGWPDCLWEDVDGRRIAIEWKRPGDSWQSGQAEVCDLFNRMGIAYVLARSADGVIANVDSLVDLGGLCRPLEIGGRWLAIENDPRFA